MTLKTQIWTIKKRDIRNFLFFEWLIKFQHKNKRKSKTTNLKILHKFIILTIIA